jgi:hypothetical protein
MPQVPSQPEAQEKEEEIKAELPMEEVQNDLE